MADLNEPELGEMTKGTPVDPDQRVPNALLFGLGALIAVLALLLFYSY